MAKYHYSIAKFVPNKMRGEFINIGVIIQSLESGVTQVRFNDNFTRLKRLCPNANVNSIIPLIDVIQAKLNRAHDVGYLMRLNDVVSGTIQFCEVSGGVTANVDQELERLYRLFVADEDVAKRSNSESSQRSVTARVRRSFQQSEFERLHHLSAMTVLPELGVRFPLVNTGEDVAPLLIQTVSLSRGKEKQALDAVKLFAKNADYVNKEIKYRDACLVALVQEPEVDLALEAQKAVRILRDSYPHVLDIDGGNSYVQKVAEAAGILG